MHPYTNELIKETSPYLLQHAHNPVNWVAWSDEAFEQAKRENKLVLVSIGYSACHWCHVMEHECFEDEEVATWMNRYFVCIKVDREERPDVDQVYMTAVQLMTQRGGWPLNCFTLPDGRPIYGGTYFPKEQWIQVLRSLEHTYKNRLDEVLDYAEKMQQGIQQSELIDEAQPVSEIQQEKLDELVQRWAHSFDTREGGNNRAPKFPLPSNWEFLLYYGVTFKNEKVLKQVDLSLHKMAFGGIYDHLAGGFCRYSVDVLWKIPHFEKMLYDNGQLLSVYAQAYQFTQNETYKETVYSIAAWLENEMSTEDGAFYAALDADSEGVEGKFYIWTKEELKNLLGDDFEWAKEYYNMNHLGYWEDDHYVLIKTKTTSDFAKSQNWDLETAKSKIAKINSILLSERAKRVRPGLDSKCLTSWNAMTIKGFCDAYKAFGEETFLLAALKTGRWIVEKQLQKDGSLFHNYNRGTSSIDAFLEDYAHTIQAFVALYQVTFDDDWLRHAMNLMDYAKTNFEHETSAMFYFTNENHSLIARKMELNDNVVPASNSVMCRNLLELGTLLSKDDYIDQAKQMLMNVYDGMETYGSGYSNWALVALQLLNGMEEIAIVGPNWKEHKKNSQTSYNMNRIFSGGLSQIPPTLKEKERTTDVFYSCKNKSCSIPQTDFSALIQNKPW